MNIVGLGVLLIGLWQCSPPIEGQGEDDLMLAQVYNKALFLSEIEGIVPANSNPQDSALRVNAFVERWVRESLLMHEAEKNIPKDLNIDQLVRDYRASLVRHNYEKLIVELQLDSVVNQGELQAHYNEYKSEHVLQNPIARCFFLKIPLSAPDMELMMSWWNGRDNNDNYKNLLEYASNYASVYMLEDSSWYDVNDILGQFPPKLIKDRIIREKRTVEEKDSTHLYLLDVKDYMSEEKMPPRAYIEDQLIKLILHKRRNRLIEDTKEQIYQRELSRNNVKIYSSK